MEVSYSLRTPCSPAPAAIASSTSLFLASPCGSRLFAGDCRRVRLVSRTPSTLRRSRGSCRCLFGLGVPELAVIAGVAALVFGPKKLPEIGRSIGQTVRSFQQAAKEFETELKKEPNENETAETSTAQKPRATVSADEKGFEASATKEIN